MTLTPSHPICGTITSGPHRQVTPSAPATLTITVDDGDTVEYCNCLFWGDLAKKCLELQLDERVEVKVKRGIVGKFRGKISVEYNIKAYRREGGEWVREEKREVEPEPEVVKDNSPDNSFL